MAQAQQHGKPAQAHAATTTTAKRGRKPARNFTSNAERFKVMASERTSRALKAVRAVGNLTGSKYEHTPEQRDKIIATLTAEITRVKDRLASGGKGGAPEFTL